MAVAHLAHAEVAQGDTREHLVVIQEGQRPSVAEEFSHHSEAVEMKAAEKAIEQVKLANDVAEIQQLGHGVQTDEIVSPPVAANELM